MKRKRSAPKLSVPYLVVSFALSLAAYYSFELILLDL